MSQGKRYQAVPIVDCHEPLVSLVNDRSVTELPSVGKGGISLQVPHPYAVLGAPYGERSPYSLRKGVCDRLVLAQDVLTQAHPGWRLHVFDAYRPIAVQEFMVNRTFALQLAQRRQVLEDLSPEELQAVWNEVYQFWARPSYDPATPPPHSTGAAVDVTIVDAHGQPIAMGGEIDEISPRSHPDYYAMRDAPDDRVYHSHRQCLHQVMTDAGFQRHPNEWWHFSYGDQLWAWLVGQQSPIQVTACYGAIN